MVSAVLNKFQYFCIFSKAKAGAGPLINGFISSLMASRHHLAGHTRLFQSVDRVTAQNMANTIVSMYMASLPFEFVQVTQLE